MTDQVKSIGYPDRVEITLEGRLTLNRLNVCAKKAIDPCTLADHTLSNPTAAVHIENSKAMSPGLVHLNNQLPYRNGSVLKPSLAEAPAGEASARCVDQKMPIQSICRSLPSSSPSNNSQASGSSSDDAGHADFLLLPKPVTPSRVAQQPSRLRSFAPSSQSSSSSQTTVPSRDAAGYTSLLIFPTSVRPSSVTQQPSSHPSLANFSQASSSQTSVFPSDETRLTNFFLLPKFVTPPPPVAKQKSPHIHKIFSDNIAKPVIRSSLPDLGSRFNSTRQLAFGLSLLKQDTTSSSSPIATQSKMQGLDITKDERAWLAKMRVDTVEHDRLRWLASQVVTQFLKRQHKDAGSIEEVLLLGAVLERKDYRGVLSALIGQLEREKLTDVDLLQALIQFLQSAPPNHLVDDDFIRILRVLRRRLKDTHKALNDKGQPGSDYVYHLSTAIALVLDAMIAGNIHGLDNAEDHQPLLDLLAELKESVDPYLKFQATYAWQALQYVGDDETPLHAALRYEGGVTKAGLDVTSASNFDPGHLIDGLCVLGQAAGQPCDVVKAGMEEAQASRAGEEGIVDNMLKRFRSGDKQPWYLALQRARVFIREGRLSDFEHMIYETPCYREPEFQMGVCQLLGEVAVDPIWELKTRLQAVDLLGYLYRSDAVWVANTGVKFGILGIILYLSMTEDEDVVILAQSAIVFENLAYDRAGTPPSPYPLVRRLPIPTTSPLLDKAFVMLSVEHNLLRMKTLRLAHYDQTIYIPPLAKANPQTPEEEATPLMDQVKEFLESERQVFLVSGDSGSGKSIFSLYLEHTLWKAYEQGDHCIPLYVHLPTILSLTSLIDEQLNKYHLDNLTIQELKQAGRKFIVICDGYDEARLTTNLHSSNGWNRPFGWDVKMIVSCRSTHLGREYRTRFQPTPKSPYHAPLSHLFQEAVIVPFSQGQVKEYVEQFVQDPTAHELFSRKEVQWSVEKYLSTIERIPNLAELVKNPFLLTLALRALPDVAMNGERGTDSTTTNTATAGVTEMTRSQLYKSFVDQWLEINKLRLTTSLTFQCPTTAYISTTTTPAAASTLQDLIDEGFHEIALNFLQSLAAAIYKHQRGKPIVEYWHHVDKTTWKVAFFGPELDITLLRESSPLTKVENSHFFIHRSLLEYFYSCHLARTTRPRYGFKDSGLTATVSTTSTKEDFSLNATLSNCDTGSQDDFLYSPNWSFPTPQGTFQYNSFLIPMQPQPQPQSLLNLLPLQSLPTRRQSPRLPPLTPQSLTPQSLTPQSLTPQSLTPQSLTPQSLLPYGQPNLLNLSSTPQDGRNVEPPAISTSQSQNQKSNNNHSNDNHPHVFDLELNITNFNPPEGPHPPQLQDEQKDPSYPSKRPRLSPRLHEQKLSSYIIRRQSLKPKLRSERDCSSRPSESQRLSHEQNEHQHSADPSKPLFQQPQIQDTQQYPSHPSKQPRLSSRKKGKRPPSSPLGPSRSQWHGGQQHSTYSFKPLPQRPQVQDEHPQVQDEHRHLANSSEPPRPSQLMNEEKHPVYASEPPLQQPQMQDEQQDLLYSSFGSHQYDASVTNYTMLESAESDELKVLPYSDDELVAIEKLDKELCYSSAFDGMFENVHSTLSEVEAWPCFDGLAAMGGMEQDKGPYSPSAIDSSRLVKLEHTEFKLGFESELVVKSEGWPHFDGGLMESVDLEEEPEVLQFLVERAREDEKYRGMLRGYVEKYRGILRGYVDVDLEQFAASKGLRNAKRILGLVDV